APTLAQPAARPAAGPPSPPPRNPNRRRPEGLIAFRFPGRSAPGVPFGAPFWGLPGGSGQVGQLLIGQLLIGPFLAGFPIRIDMLAKLTSAIDLLPGQFGLLSGEEPRACFSFHGAGQAEVRAVARLGILRTRAAGFAALDRALRQ